MGEAEDGGAGAAQAEGDREGHHPQGQEGDRQQGAGGPQGQDQVALRRHHRDQDRGH